MSKLTNEEQEILDYAPEWVVYYHLGGFPRYFNKDFTTVLSLDHCKKGEVRGVVRFIPLEKGFAPHTIESLKEQESKIEQELVLLESYTTLTELVTLWESNNRSLYSFCGNYLTFGDLADYFDTGNGIYFKQEVVPKTKLDIAKGKVQEYLDTLVNKCQYNPDKPEATYYDFDDFLGNGVVDIVIEDFVELCGIVYKNMKE